MTSFACEARRPAHGPGRIVALAIRVVAWPFRVLAARREFATLAAMDAHELRDIGLTRSDISNATALPLDEDPTRFLANAAADLIAAERAQARRRAALRRA